jgi:hypothetical protein
MALTRDSHVGERFARKLQSSRSMSSSARRAPTNDSLNPGADIRGPLRNQLSARTPGSGVRAAPGHAPQEVTRAAKYVPPRPELDSNDMTHISSPPPKLLAMARGEDAKAEAARAKKMATRRVRWFALGVLVGGMCVWSVTSDVRADVYGARIWIADSLRSMHAMSKPSSAVEAPAPEPDQATPTDPAPPKKASAKTAAAVPTVDVGVLPHAQGTPSPSLRSQSTGAPVLANAPGPR